VNHFTLEQNYNIQMVIMYVLIVFAVVTLVFSIRAFRHRREEKLYYDQMPAWSIWLSGTIVGSIIAFVIYTNIFTFAGLADYTYDLSHRRQQLIYGRCEYIQKLGCPDMWEQFRTDSLWVEEMLKKYRK